MKTLLTLFLLIIGYTGFAQTRAYTIVFLNKNPNADQMSKEQVDKIMEGHTANRVRLHKEGKLLAAGPFEGGGGLYILNTNSIDEAKEWVSADPGVQAKRWNVEIFPYKTRHGSVCPVKEPYEMVSYQIVRYDAVVSKFTASNYPKILKSHDDYLQKLINTGNVITEATFGENSGGILVIKGQLEKEVIEADPGVQEGLLELQVKKLYIAKGSLCEP